MGIVITTKGGDKGSTSLGDGKRVQKDDPSVEAYGTIDECQAALGLARSLCDSEGLKAQISKMEEELYKLMGVMAKCKGLETPEISWMEDVIKKVSNMFKGENFVFLKPGEYQASAALHLARTIARRAERQSVKLLRSGDMDEKTFSYINRLSDFIYALILWYGHEKFQEKTPL